MAAMAFRALGVGLAATEKNSSVEDRFRVSDGFATVSLGTLTTAPPRLTLSCF